MEIKQEIKRLNKQFLQSSDFIVKEIEWNQDEKVIICYYSSLVNKNEVDRNLFFLKQISKTPVKTKENNKQENSDMQNGEKSESNNNSGNIISEKSENRNIFAYDDSVTITTEQYDEKKLINYVCDGETIIILLQSRKMIRLSSPEFVHGTPEEPENEQILRGSHEGFVESFDANISLIRKRIRNNKLVVRKIILGKNTRSVIYYYYVDDLVDKEALKTVENRLNAIDIDEVYSIGQLNDNLDDQVWSPFPQLLSTERPDRVTANILEGKIAIMTDLSPTAIIGPVTFFSFYQTPDDFNSRVLVGTFYRLLRGFSLL